MIRKNIIYKIKIQSRYIDYSYTYFTTEENLEFDDSFDDIKIGHVYKHTENSNSIIIPVYSIDEYSILIKFKSNVIGHEYDISFILVDMLDQYDDLGSIGEVENTSPESSISTTEVNNTDIHIGNKVTIDGLLVDKKVDGYIVDIDDKENKATIIANLSDTVTPFEHF